MALTGALVDGVCIAVGGILGLLLKNIPERFKETVTHCIALIVILIGLQMALEIESLVMVLTSLIIGDRKSTRLNSSHVSISYAVFCLKKKKKKNIANYDTIYN